MPAELPLTVADLREDARQLVAEGSYDDDAIVDILTTWFTVDLETDETIRDPEVVRPIARRATAAALGAHRRKQARWPEVTDCDRLDTAFASLERRGVVTRQQFMDCSADGHFEIGRAMADAQAGRERPVVGFAFYHSQSTESAVAGSGLHIKFGAAAVDDEAGNKAVGKHIVRALKEAGLSPEWDGDPRAAVYVPLKWQKRRPEPTA